MELLGVSKHVLLCNGVSCTKKGAEEVTEAIREEIKNQGLLKKIHTTKTLCNGRCKDGPTVVVYPDGDWYKEMTPELGRKLIERINQNQSLETSLSYTFDGQQFTVARQTSD
jgi:(2Fe-2S) ferredoxin